jgi:4'-phosphopantetheinyl transferase
MPGDGAVAVWYARPDRVVGAGRLPACEGLLTRDELERAAAYVRPADRDLFVITRALVRTALSRYAPVRPADWRFRRSALGRPEIDSPAAVPPLSFSLTHTAGFCGCAVAHHPVGIDAEREGRPVTDDLIGSCLSPAEKAEWTADSPREPAAAFLTRWTLKEAYLKARGLGLQLPPTAVGFRPRPDGTAEGLFDPTCDDDPTAWQFRHFRLAGTHVAVAVRHPGPIDLALHEVSPEDLADSAAHRGPVTP